MPSSLGSRDGVGTPPGTGRWDAADFSPLSELFAMGPVQFSWPRGVTENSFTKPGFWEGCVGFPRKNSKTQSSLNFLQSGPRTFTKSDFSGLAPIRWVPTLFFGEIMIGAVLFWKPWISRLQLQSFSRCYATIHYCNVSSFLYRIWICQNIIFRLTHHHLGAPHSQEPISSPCFR